MADICKHCRGTTFCGGSYNAGQLKTQPACPSCLIKSKLNPNGIYDRVVCSVCGGSGVAVPEKKSRSRRGLTAEWLIAFVAVLLALVFSASTSIYYYLETERYRTIVENFLRDQGNDPSKMSIAEVKSMLKGGMTRKEVREAIGDPNATKVIDSGLVVIELWTYRCQDGRLQLSLADGKLQAMN
jgi:hypothetical protein